MKATWFFTKEDIDISSYGLSVGESTYINLPGKKAKIELHLEIDESKDPFQTLEELFRDLSMVKRIYATTQSKNPAIINQLKELKLFLELTK